MTKKKRKKAKVEAPKRRMDLSYLGKHGNLLSIVIISGLLCVFFYPVVFGGKTLLPPDTLTAKSFRPFVRDALNRGIYPLWNPYIFSGMPSFASLSSAPYVDLIGTLMNWTIAAFRFVIPLTDFTRIFLNYFLLGLFVYLLFRRKKFSSGVALFAGLALIFTPQVIAYSAFGHNTKLLSAVLIPLIFLLVDELLERRNLLYFAATALAIGLQLLRAHVQICYYTLLMVGLYFLYWAITGGKKREIDIKDMVKGLGLLIAAILLGFALSSWLYLSVHEYSQYSIRGSGTGGGLSYAYATNWSFSPAEIATFFIPSFMGFGGETYWGKMPFTDFPLYMGIIPLLFAGLALTLKRDKYTVFFLILGLFALVVSFGKHLPILYGPMFKLLPYFNKFRAPNMIQILLQFSVAVLAGYGLAYLIKFRDSFRQKGSEKKTRSLSKYLYTFGGICGILFLFLLLGKGIYLHWVRASGRVGDPWLQQEAYRSALNDGLKMLFLFGFATVFILFYLRRKIGSGLFQTLIFILLILDLWSVDFKIIHPQPKADEKAFFQETKVVKFLKNDRDLYRIFPIYDEKPANWYMYQKIQNIYGYHPAKLRVYQEALEELQLPGNFLLKYLKRTVEDGRPVTKFRSLEEVRTDLLAGHAAFLNMLNVKYVVIPYPIPDPQFQLVLDDRIKVYRNVNYLPRAYFVDKIILLKEKDKIFKFIKSGNFDPSQMAILEEEAEFPIEPSGRNKVRITSYDLHTIELEAEVEKPTLLVLSEIYYPAGWKAYVDGVEKKIYKTNYILRSIFLSPGQHKIRFAFDPSYFKLGISISVATFVLLGSLLFIGWRRERRKESKNSRFR